MARRRPFKHADRPTGCSPYSGTAPPVATRFQPGRSGNPKGRPATGATVRDWVNALAGRTRAEVRAVAADPSATRAKAEAAWLWLNAPTLARRYTKSRAVNPSLVAGPAGRR